MHSVSSLQGNPVDRWTCFHLKGAVLASLMNMRCGSEADVEHGEVLFMRSSPCANTALLGTRDDCLARSFR